MAGFNNLTGNIGTIKEAFRYNTALSLGGFLDIA